MQPKSYVYSKGPVIILLLIMSLINNLFAINNLLCDDENPYVWCRQ